MKVFRLLQLVRNASGLSSQGLKSFSSSCSSSAANPRFSNFSGAAEDVGSAVYEHALKFQRPTTIKWRKNLHNFVSFIGSIDRPLKTMSRRCGGFDVSTFLAVNSPNSFRTLRILLVMQDDIAEVALQYLKPNDFIYVSGSLAFRNGDLRTLYKVYVKELNYVAQRGQSPKCQKSEESQSWEDIHESAMEKKRNRIHLWQVFFANPYEWWDNRKCKSNPRQPDFRHKDTSEALWLSPDDPDWIIRQLQLLDSKMAEHGPWEYEGQGRRARLSVWELE